MGDIVSLVPEETQKGEKIHLENSHVSLKFEYIIALHSCKFSFCIYFHQVGLAALSLGMIFVGTCNEEVGSVLVQRLMESSDLELESPMARLVSLGLGLLFIGKNEKSDAMMEASAFFIKSLDLFFYRYITVSTFYILKIIENRKETAARAYYEVRTVLFSVLRFLLVCIYRSVSFITTNKAVSGSFNLVSWCIIFVTDCEDDRAPHGAIHSGGAGHMCLRGHG